MTASRRDFLTTAGLAALGGAGLGAAGLRLALAQGAPGGGAGRYALVVDLPRWVELAPAIRQRCFDACHRVHNVPDLSSDRSPLPPAERRERQAVRWIREVGFEAAFAGQYHAQLAAALRDAAVPVLCNHCDRPPCVRVCPTGATWRREDGAVMMDMHRCIGCRYCIIACPYGARSFNFRDPLPGLASVDPGFPTRTRGVVEKCSFCVERLDVGGTPACVEALGAELGDRSPFTFGRLDDPRVAGVLTERFTIRRRPELGTAPHVFYAVG
jgi:molybdopterin-containing oxidoreductase family iron-sulfur binding subunit